MCAFFFRDRKKKSIAIDLVTIKSDYALLCESELHNTNECISESKIECDESCFQPKGVQMCGISMVAKNVDGAKWSNRMRKLKEKIGGEMNTGAREDGVVCKVMRTQLQNQMAIIALQFYYYYLCRSFPFCIHHYTAHLSPHLLLYLHTLLVLC